MKKYTFAFALILSAFAFSAFAQEEFSSRRLNNLVADLKRETVDLVDRTSENLRRGYSSSRSDIEAAFIAQQLDASVGLFDQMVRDNRKGSELRDAASILSDLGRRTPSYGSNTYNWNNVRSLINDINREVGGYGGNGGNNGDGNPPDNKPIIGRAYWRGTVDDKIRIKIQSKDLFVETVSGQNYPEGTFSFTAPLPSSNVSIGVNKKKGRGEAVVVQQPNRANNFVGVIEVRDPSGGARDYELEIFWR